MLYRRFDVGEETPIQFVGVYVTRWRPEWGKPSVMFREAKDDEMLEAARQLPEVKALDLAAEAALRILSSLPTDFDEFHELFAALVALRGEDDSGQK